MLIFSFFPNSTKIKLHKILSVCGILSHVVVIKEHKSQEKCHVLVKRENGLLGWILRTAEQVI